MRQFNLHADAYDQIRGLVTYPEALYGRISSACAARGAALDLGCGNGVSTARLAPYFARVEGVDLGEELIAKACARHPTLRFHVSPAEEFSPDEQVDLVACATAFYWMNRDAVLARVAAWLSPGGVFAAYRYDFPVVYGPARDVVERELALRWARHRDPRLIAYDDTLERIEASSRFVDAERFVVPNTLALSARQLALFFLSTSYVSRMLDAEGAGASERAEYGETLMAALEGATEGAKPDGTIRVNFDVHAVMARLA